MNFDEFKARFNAILQESNCNITVSERDLTKMFVSHVVMGQYNKELAAAAAVTKKIIVP